MSTTQLTTLSNGIRVVSDTISAVETVTMGAWVDVGSRNETPELNGISHMLEHMAFKGTHKRDARQIAEEIEAVGGYLNAYTSREITAYHARILKDDVPLATDILADILQNSVFDEQEFAREQSVIIQEIGQSNDTPDDIIFDYYQDCCYPNQALGRPILGTVAHIESFTPEHVRSYIKNNYGTQQLVIAAAGKIDHDDLVDSVEELFAHIPERQVICEPATFQGGTKLYQKDLEQAHVVFGFEGVSFNHPDYYASSLLSAILGGGMSSRLFQEIRERRGLVYSIYSFSSSYRDTGQFGVYAGTGPEKIEELLDAIYIELKRFHCNVSDSELKRAKSQLTAGLMMGLESTTNRCEQAARQILTYGELILPQTLRKKIEGVTISQVRALAEKIFESPSVLTTLGPVDTVPSYQI